MARRIVYGMHAVGRLLRTAPGHLQCVYLQTGLGRERLARMRPWLDDCPVEIRECSPQQLQHTTGTDKHQGIAALVEVPDEMTEAEARDYVQSLEQPLLLVLDGIQDPRNFGSCLRTADAAGTDLVITGRSRGVPMTPAVSKVAAGAAEAQPVARVGNLARFLGFLRQQGVWIVGTDDQATDSLYAADLTGPVALVMGAEDRGLRRLTRERCDLLVSLPMQGVVESLNIAVATGICLYECRRQRSAARLAPDRAVR